MPRGRLCRTRNRVPASLFFFCHIFSLASRFQPGVLPRPVRSLTCKSEGAFAVCLLFFFLAIANIYSYYVLVESMVVLSKTCKGHTTGVAFFVSDASWTHFLTFFEGGITCLTRKNVES